MPPLPSRLRALGDLLLILAATAALARAQKPAHWAFQPPTRPPISALPGDTWTRNPIDHFVALGLADFELDPSPEADRSILLRRVTFDLTGLPPTPAEVRAFREDIRPDAFERLVDRLLASPARAERMAQHWLDLARYADTDGFEYDAARPQAWRYRDWVVAAFASDMPYDRFVQLQNAADQLVPGDASSLVATGFHRAYPDMVDLNDQGLRRQNALNDITETTAQVFLGLTLGCARCHDHKTDPLPQRDFYRLQAFFTPAQFVNDQPPLKSEVSDGSAPAASSVRGLSETTGPPPPTFVLLRGDYGRRGDAVTPGFPSVLAASGSGPILATADPPHRADLARWLTEPDHPLTARVIVNRQWQQSFGRGIVSTAGDFGLAGEPPSHPELLDWLATELVAQNWSLQAIQRLIVTSAVYRQSSTFRARGAELDPENTLLWRQNRRRLDGEALRDAILASSGRLTRAIGGPGVFPELPPELAGQVPKNLWPTSPSAADRTRRSLYTFVRRNLRYPLFEAFDRPDTNASCPTRASSTTAPQALSLLNSVLVQESAGALAGTIAALLPADRQAQVSLCFESILARQPDAPEAAACVRFLDAGGDLAALCVALYNTNPFIYLD